MQAKLLFLLSSILVVSLTTQAQKPTCKSLHNGAYKISSKETGTTFITRSKKQQVEKNEELGYEIIFDITWIDECTYELRPKKLIKGDPAIMGDGSSYVRTRIKNITEKGYTAETTASFSPDKVDFVVEIVR
jgi:hypothetical protein